MIDNVRNDRYTQLTSAVASIALKARASFHSDGDLAALVPDEP